MDLKDKDTKLPLVIPPTIGLTLATEETTADISIPKFMFQPYYSPVSPPKHPYRPGTYTGPEQAVKRDKILTQVESQEPRAEDITSPNLLAVANLLSSMKETFVLMTRTFNALEEQSQRLASLPLEAKRIEDIRSANSELETLITRQKTDMQEVRRRLESDIRIALENQLRESLTTMIHESVAKEVEGRVRQELAAQVPKLYRKGPEMDDTSAEPLPQFYGGGQLDPGTPSLTQKDHLSQPLESPALPVLLKGPTREETDPLSLQQEVQVKEEPSDIPVFSVQDYDSYPPVKIPILLFDEYREHEPPPPSPAPTAGLLRPLLRPLPTPEQSPSYIVHNVLPSRPASNCATPLTAYPGVPAPTPITNEPVIMVLPMKGASINTLSPVLEAKDLDPLFTLSSDQNKELLKSYSDLDGFVVPSPMAEWPRARTIIKTPKRNFWSSSISPQPVNGESEYYYAETPTASLDTPVLPAPPRRHEAHTRNSLSHNLKLLPPLIIT